MGGSAWWCAGTTAGSATARGREREAWPGPMSTDREYPHLTMLDAASGLYGKCVRGHGVCVCSGVCV